MVLRAEKVARVPQYFARESLHHGILKMKGLTVIESCSFTNGRKGTMFLEDHLLLFVLEGTYTVRFGSQEYIVRKNEMILLQKAIAVEYEKSGEAGADYILDYMMFFLKEELLTEFIKMADLQSHYPSEFVPVSIISVNERLIGYIHSLKPYFNEADPIRDGLMKVKLMELLLMSRTRMNSFCTSFCSSNAQRRKALPKWWSRI